MNDYRTITLVSRNINCSTITVEEFIRAMFSDLLEAEEKYNELYIPEWEDKKFKDFAYHLKCIRKRAINFAEKKWKTEKKRNEYIKNEVKKARENYKFDNFFYGLSFFDFDVNPGEMGIPSDCIISYNELTPEKLRRCFEKIKDNKYFKKALGWKLTYEAYDNSYKVCSRPEIKLIVDKNTMTEMYEDKNKLIDSVYRFYEGCKYWGD
jgi:hypothetical protein